MCKGKEVFLLTRFSNDLLKQNYNIALSTVKDVIGANRVKEKMREVTEVNVSPRALQRHGCCKYYGNKCVIEVSKHLFNVDNKEMITTLIHEILHTFKDTKGHGEMWQWYAKKISDNTCYHITACRNIEGIENNYKYKVECIHCGQVSYKCRLTNYRLHCFKTGSMRCRKCGHTEFKIEDLKAKKKIL